MREKTEKFIKNRFSIAILTFALCAVIGVTATIAWYTGSDGAEMNKMEMAGTSPHYEISSLPSGTNGIYYEYYSVIKPEEEDNVMVWQMTDTSNLDNYGGMDAGIAPGASGKISFVVTPKTESVNLSFDLEVVGYLSHTQGQTITMEEITNESLMNYLNGHILLFENCEDGKYSGLIASDADRERVFNRTFSGKNTPATVDIYWVWPEHFSNLVNAYNGSSVTEQPFLDTNSSSYTDMINHISDYPRYYLKGNTEDAALTDLTELKIKNNYETYGGLYDSADNDIGTGVEFLLVRLTVSEWE